MNNPQIENNFKYHQPKTLEVTQAHENVRMMARNFADAIDRIVPNSREKSLAMTKIEEAMMWANAAIARNQEVE